MTEAPAKAPGITWDNVVPSFRARLREPKLPAKPSDGAIAMAQRSYDGTIPEGGTEALHVMTHRFPNAESADLAADELKRAGAYTSPVTTVNVTRGEKGDGDGDLRIVHWRAGPHRGPEE